MYGRKGERRGGSVDNGKVLWMPSVVEMQGCDHGSVIASERTRALLLKEKRDVSPGYYDMAPEEPESGVREGSTDSVGVGGRGTHA